MRSRNIKPGFFQNEYLVELPPEARLLFIGLWLMADREGRLEDRPKKIKMQVFPADCYDVEGMIAQLSDAGLIIRYEVDSKRYISIPAWHKHQNPHVKEKDSIIPAPDSHSANTEQAEKSNEPTGLIPDSLIPDSLIPSRATKRVPKKWKLTVAGDEFAVKCGMTSDDIAEQLEAFRDHEYKTAKADWDACWRTWCRNWKKWSKDKPRGKLSYAEQLAEDMRDKGML